MYFSHWVPDLELILTRCQKWMLQNHCIPHDVYIMQVMTSAGFDAKSTWKSGLKFCFDSTVLLNAMLLLYFDSREQNLA